MYNKSIYISSWLLFNLLFCVKTSAQITSLPDTVDVITYKINGKTASGIHTSKIPYPFAAVSRDLLKKYPLRSKIELKNCQWKGVYTVMDIMHRRHRATIDIYYKGKRKNNMVQCTCIKVEN